MTAEATVLKGYRAARDRIESYVAWLGRSKGVVVDVELDRNQLDEVVTSTHAIRLSVGKQKRIVAIDHRSFVEDDDYFLNFVFPQIQTAVDELVAAP